MSESGTAERDAVVLGSEPARSAFAEEPVDPAADARLLEAAARGDADAFAELWSLHRGAAYAVARSVAPGNADDVVSEAYATIWARLQRDSVPVGAFRAHLLETVRGISARWFRAGRQAAPVPVVEDIPDPTIGDAMESVEERAMILSAFAALPDRWQQVLQWRAVERLSRAETAKRLGITPNSVSVLGRRAVEGLRVAWLAQWLPTPPGGIEHARVFEALPRYVRDSLPRERAALLRSHLRGCGQCRSAEQQLLEANRRLGGGILGVLFLGGAGSALTAALRAADPVAPAAFAVAGGTGAANGAAAIRPLAALGGMGALRAGFGKVATVVGGKIAIGSTGLVLGSTLAAAAIAGTVVLAHPFDPQAPVTLEADAGWSPDRRATPSDDGSATAGAPRSVAKRGPGSPGVAGVEPGAGLGAASGQDPSGAGSQLMADVAPREEPLLPESPLRPGSEIGEGDRAVAPSPPPAERPDPPAQLPAPTVRSTGDAGGTIAPKLSGTAEPGATIAVAVAGTRILPTVAADGTWTADLADLDLRPGSQRADITQARGDRVSPAAAVAFSLTAPKVELTALPVRSIDTTRFVAAFSVTGGVPGATVCVSAGAAQPSRIQLDSHGAYERGLVLYPTGTKALVFAYCDAEQRFGVRQRIAIPSAGEPGAPADPAPADPSAPQSAETASGSAD